VESRYGADPSVSAGPRVLLLEGDDLCGWPTRNLIEFGKKESRRSACARVDVTDGAVCGCTRRTVYDEGYEDALERVRAWLDALTNSSWLAAMGMHKYKTRTIRC